MKVVSRQSFPHCKVPVYGTTATFRPYVLLSFCLEFLLDELLPKAIEPHPFVSILKSFNAVVKAICMRACIIGLPTVRSLLAAAFEAECKNLPWPSTHSPILQRARYGKEGIPYTESPFCFPSLRNHRLKVRVSEVARGASLSPPPN